MLRLQAPLPDEYTRATEDDLVERISTAKQVLGDRLVILGHHYQRDEVIRWADAVGDSFKLARFAADNDRATDIVFCGVHFMAESADVLTADHRARHPPRPERRVLDGGHGRRRAGRGQLGADRGHDGDRTGRADHVHELVRRPEVVRRPPWRRGVHLVQCACRARVGAGEGRQGAVLPRPAPGPEHRLHDGLRRDRHAGLESPCRPRRSRGARGQGIHAPLVEGTLFGTPAVPPGARGRRSARAPGRRRHRPPRVRARRRRARGPRGLHRTDPGVGARARRPARRSRSAPKCTWCSGSRRNTPTRRSSRSTR